MDFYVNYKDVLSWLEFISLVGLSTSIENFGGKISGTILAYTSNVLK